MELIFTFSDLTLDKRNVHLTTGACHKTSFKNAGNVRLYCSQELGLANLIPKLSEKSNIGLPTRVYLEILACFILNKYCIVSNV